MVNGQRSKPNPCVSNSPFKPQSLQSSWEKHASCMLLQLWSIICVISICHKWSHKKFYLFTGYVSSACVVGHLSIVGCILWTRESKTPVSSQLKTTWRNREDCWASGYSVLLHSRSSGHSSLGWPDKGLWRLYKSYLRPRQHALQTSGFLGSQGNGENFLCPLVAGLEKVCTLSSWWFDTSNSSEFTLFGETWNSFHDAEVHFSMCYFMFIHLFMLHYVPELIWAWLLFSICF